MSGVLYAAPPGGEGVRSGAEALSLGASDWLSMTRGLFEGDASGANVADEEATISKSSS